MKKWPPYVPAVTIQAPKIDEPKKPEEQKLSTLECVSCGKVATMLFEGTSYCRGCMKDFMKTGISRRFYNA